MTSALLGNLIMLFAGIGIGWGARTVAGLATGHLHNTT